MLIKQTLTPRIRPNSSPATPQAKKESPSDSSQTVASDSVQLTQAAPEPLGHQAVSKEQMRDSMKRWPTGVAVIGVASEVDGKEKLHGMTASSVSSLSLTPPLLSFSANSNSRTVQMAKESGEFSVNFLAHDQVAPCWNFSSKPDDRWEGQDYHLGSKTGSPLLDGATTHLECELSQIVEVADGRVLVIGQVVNSEANPADPEPLVNYSNQMGRFQAPEKSA